VTIEQADKVDGMGIDSDKGEVVLVISDHLDWLDQALHFSRLEQKIDNYINFVQSAQLEEVMPQGKGMGIRIKLVQQFAAPSEVKSILDGIAQQLFEIGIAFTCEEIPAGY
jgi:hypothetical protein